MKADIDRNRAQARQRGIIHLAMRDASSATRSRTQGRALHKVGHCIADVVDPEPHPR
jgi:hypothetical protein